ncbi:hypothetical protein [Sporosarcina sp. FSL K6-5500]|uniref:hypothetical protein n=1 Tax=Sporosarcina sp. FSL K6-5500 TaxID=2921558 RepID=UPI0030F6548E
MERIHQLHPTLLKGFPKIKELDELVQTFRNLFAEKRSGKLVDWLEIYEQIDYPFITSFHPWYPTGYECCHIEYSGAME